MAIWQDKAGAWLLGHAVFFYDYAAFIQPGLAGQGPTLHNVLGSRVGPCPAVKRWQYNQTIQQTH